MKKKNSCKRPKNVIKSNVAPFNQSLIRGPEGPKIIAFEDRGWPPHGGVDPMERPPHGGVTPRDPPIPPILGTPPIRGIGGSDATCRHVTKTFVMSRKLFRRSETFFRPPEKFFQFLKKFDNSSKKTFLSSVTFFYRFTTFWKFSGIPKIFGSSHFFTILKNFQVSEKFHESRDSEKKVVTEKFFKFLKNFVSYSFLRIR